MEFFIELLKLSEEEFGIPRDGPIVLPCEAIFLDYVVFLIENKVEKAIIEALVRSGTSSGGSSRSCSMTRYIHQERHTQQLSLYGF